MSVCLMRACSKNCPDFLISTLYFPFPAKIQAGLPLIIIFPANTPFQAPFSSAASRIIPPLRQNSPFCPGYNASECSSPLDLRHQTTVFKSDRCRPTPCPSSAIQGEEVPVLASPRVSDGPGFHYHRGQQESLTRRREQRKGKPCTSWESLCYTSVRNGIFYVFFLTFRCIQHVSCEIRAPPRSVAQRR